MSAPGQDELIDKALDALRTVDDPEVGLNVVDLGLIYEIEIGPDAREVDCLMTFTTEFCPMGASIQAGVTEALKMTFPEAAVQVRITFDPPWSQSMISEAGRMFLGG
ncbi:MAG: metal-sulfur cluster assembly factor [Flavobacteriales bacterium]|nr:Fe-S protein maturation auxiliary factor SufT [Flavobacteriales bacterium]MCC6575843.1 metal-sulfur cluster assembly factor [Flavobacteriales bacterium]NUQ13850.1 metal-sulfur cluster assembly factor [Flavobacteriales bacterium]